MMLTVGLEYANLAQEPGRPNTKKKPREGPQSARKRKWFLTQMYARFWNDLADHASASR